MICIYFLNLIKSIRNISCRFIYHLLLTKSYFFIMFCILPTLPNIIIMNTSLNIVQSSPNSGDQAQQINQLKALINIFKRILSANSPTLDETTSHTDTEGVVAIAQSSTACQAIQQLLLRLDANNKNLFISQIQLTIVVKQVNVTVPFANTLSRITDSLKAFSLFKSRFQSMMEWVSLSSATSVYGCSILWTVYLQVKYSWLQTNGQLNLSLLSYAILKYYFEHSLDIDQLQFEVPFSPLDPSSQNQILQQTGVLSNQLEQYTRLVQHVIAEACQTYFGNSFSTIDFRSKSSRDNSELFRIAFFLRQNFEKRYLGKYMALNELDYHDIGEALPPSKICPQHVIEAEAASNPFGDDFLL